MISLVLIFQKILNILSIIFQKFSSWLSSHTQHLFFMEHKEADGNNSERNFTTISPTAKSLLRMKGYTRLPFAAQVAGLAMRPVRFEPDFHNKDFMFWTRVFHFEARYKSVDTLMQDLSIKNIL